MKTPNTNVIRSWIGAHLPMRMFVGKSLDVLNSYIQRFVDKTMTQSSAELQAIPEKDRNLVQQLAVQDRDSKVLLEARPLQNHFSLMLV